MMATELPDILPEPFSNPCASYKGSAENYISSCGRTVYNNSGYFSVGEDHCHSFDSETSHHSLVLNDSTTRGRSSYSCESNIIQLRVTESPDSFSVVKELNCSSPVEDRSQVTRGDWNMCDEGVRVRVEQMAEQAPSSPAKRLRRLGMANNLLRPDIFQSSPSCSSISSDSQGSPTPTPSYTAQTSSQKTLETMSPVRGEVAAEFAEEEGETARPELGSSHPGPEERRGTESWREPEDGNTDGHLHGEEVPSHVPRRRSHLSHLRTIQSPHLPLPVMETRKLSDPAIQVRKQKLKSKLEEKKHRCLSDSEAPPFPFLMDDESFEEGCSSSALGGDSGYMDERSSRYQETVSTYALSSPRISQYSDIISLEDSGDQRIRRLTPFNPLSQESGLSDEHAAASTSSNPGTMVHPRERSRRSMLKHFSQSSIGGASIGGASIGGASVGGNSSVGASSDSPSLSSMLETQSNLTCATDILSSLGFDDFDSPQLVPDRFIPKELEHLRPSSMKAAFLEQILSSEPPKSPDSLVSGQSSNLAPFTHSVTSGHSSNTAPPALSHARSPEPADLPLGATAENFLPVAVPRPSSPIIAPLSEVKVDEPHSPASPAEAPLFTDTAPMLGFTRNRILETVPEETASDLSPSPRWLSPRVSIDHSVLDLAEGKLGASLKVRRRSLPTREGYRLSIGSLVESDTGDSIHLSVTSYDDEIAAEREREREGLMPGVNDETAYGGRRRRRGVYTPPQTLLSWLSTQKTIDEEADTDPDELPWPFNEQARLRKSLTEISLAQQESFQSEASSIGTYTSFPRRDSDVPTLGSRDLSPPVSPISTPNSRLSPQPTLSEAEEDDLGLADFQVEAKQHSHAVTVPDSTAGFTAADCETGHQDCSSVAANVAIVVQDENEAVPEASDTVAALERPIRQSVGPTRQRRMAIAPLNLSRASLPALAEGYIPPLTLSEDTPTQSSPPHHQTDIEDTGSPSEPRDTPDGDVCSPTEISQATSPVSTPITPKPSSSANYSRRPRLCSLRQISVESPTEADMSEIELLTGDIHSPVSSKRPHPPFRRQKSVEEAEVASPRPARRVAMVGGAPSASLLSATKNQSEVEKFMIL